MPISRSKVVVVAARIPYPLQECHSPPGVSILPVNRLSIARDLFSRVSLTFTNSNHPRLSSIPSSSFDRHSGGQGPMVECHLATWSMPDFSTLKSYVRHTPLFSKENVVGDVERSLN